MLVATTAIMEWRQTDEIHRTQLMKEKGAVHFQRTRHVGGSR
jgi:hypothetical protein